MLMDLFFEATKLKEKRRVHFHDFMLETHAFIFEWRKLPHAERRRHPAHVHDAGAALDEQLDLGQRDRERARDEVGRHLLELGPEERRLEVVGAGRALRQERQVDLGARDLRELALRALRCLPMSGGSGRCMWSRR